MEGVSIDQVCCVIDMYQENPSVVVMALSHVSQSAEVGVAWNGHLYVEVQSGSHICAMIDGILWLPCLLVMLDTLITCK